MKNATAAIVACSIALCSGCSTPDSEFVFKNETSKTLMIYVGGDDSIKLQAGESKTVSDLKSGEHYIVFEYIGKEVREVAKTVSVGKGESKELSISESEFWGGRL